MQTVCFGLIFVILQRTFLAKIKTLFIFFVQTDKINEKSKNSLSCARRVGRRRDDAGRWLADKHQPEHCIPPQSGARRSDRHRRRLQQPCRRGIPRRRLPFLAQPPECPPDPHHRHPLPHLRSQPQQSRLSDTHRRGQGRCSNLTVYPGSIQQGPLELPVRLRHNRRRR